jgi:hypothetical protein
MNLVHIPASYFFKTHFIIILYLCQGPLSGCFPSGFATKTCASIFSRMDYIPCQSHALQFDQITKSFSFNFTNIIFIVYSSAIHTTFKKLDGKYRLLTTITVVCQWKSYNMPFNGFMLLRYHALEFIFLAVLYQNEKFQRTGCERLAMIYNYISTS